MKNKKIIIGIIAGVVLLAGGVVAWQIISKKKAEEKRIKDNTVVLESEGYDFGVKMLAWKDKFWTEIENEDTPRYPELKIADREKTVKINVELKKVSDSGRANMLEHAKKKESFVEIKADEKSGSLGGYASLDAFGMIVRLDVEKEKEYTKVLEMIVKDANDAKNSKVAFEKPEVQDLIKSVRKTDYKAPQKDYVSDYKELYKVKKIDANFKGFEVKQESSDTGRIEIVAKKDKDTEISVGFYIKSMKKNLDQVISEDYFVKKGDRKYSEEFTFEGGKGKATVPKDALFGSKAVKYYFEKDGAIFSGYADYPKGEEYRTIAGELVMTILKNIQVDVERVKKKVTY